MSLHIVHVVCSDSYAGVERYVQRTAIEQARRGHRVTVLGGSPTRMAPPLADARVGHVPASGVLAAVRALRRLPDADVVNTHMTAADVAGVLVRASARFPVVATRHFAQPRGRFGPIPIDALVRSRIDSEIAISAAVAAAIGTPSTVVYTGVLDADQVAVDANRAILMAQRLQPEKHTTVGVRAFAASGLAAAGWRLLIAGEGPERAELDRLRRELGVVEAVDLLGFRDDVGDLLNRSALLLATCPREGLGLTVLEAMAHGLPVVAAGAAGHLDLLSGLDPDLLFAPDDVDEAGRRLRALAIDPKRRLDLGCRLRQRQRAGFSVSAQIEGTERVYRKAMGRR